MYVYPYQIPLAEVLRRQGYAGIEPIPDDHERMQAGSSQGKTSLEPEIKPIAMIEPHSELQTLHRTCAGY